MGVQDEHSGVLGIKLELIRVLGDVERAITPTLEMPPNVNGTFCYDSLNLSLPHASTYFSVLTAYNGAGASDAAHRERGLREEPVRERHGWWLER